MHRFARLIRRFIQLQFYLIRAQCPGAIGIILPVITRLKTYAADDLFARLHLKPVTAPLDREAHLAAAARRQSDHAFIFLQVFGIVTRLPAFAVRKAPVVIAPFAD